MAAEDELWEHIVYTKPIHTNDGAGHHSVLVHKSRFPARQVLFTVVPYRRLGQGAL